MRPFYGIDRTENKKNNIRDDRCFIAASTSAASSAALDQAAERAAVQMKRSKLPAPLNIIKNVCGFIALILFLSILRSIGDITIEDLFEKLPGLVWTLGILAAVWMVLSIIGGLIRRNVESTEEYTVAVSRMTDRIDAAYRELGVPRDAKEVDVLSIRYRWKKGKMKPTAIGREFSARTSEPLMVYVRDGKLCLADAHHRYEIPLSELKCLRSIKKHIHTQGWNKPEEYDMGFYKPYKLTMDDYKRIHMKRYGILELEHAGESWGIWLPPYELNYISALTGLKITEQ